jgi:hypothetical protein
MMSRGSRRNSADFASLAAHLGRVEVDCLAIIGEISPLHFSIRSRPFRRIFNHAIRRRAADSEFRDLKHPHTIVNPVPARQVTT